MFDFKNKESFVYTKGLKLVGFIAVISLVLVLIFDEKFVILEEAFRLIAIICQSIVVILLGTRSLMIEKNVAWGIVCYSFVTVILGWVMYCKFLL